MPLAYFDIQNKNGSISGNEILGAKASPFELDVTQYEEIGIWYSLPAALSTKPIACRFPRIHVHLRPEAGGKKVVDRDFHALSILCPEKTPLFIAASGAHEFLKNKNLNPVLEDLQKLRRQKAGSVVPDRSIDLDLYPDCDYLIWTSTPAILWIADRPEEQGVHVHVIKDGKLIVDETFGDVRLKGESLDRERLLAAMLERTERPN